MKKETKVSDYILSNFWWMLACFILTYHLIRDVNEPPVWKNPRTMRGVDTLYTPDSAYVIKFEIDTVFEPEVEPDILEGPY